MSTNAFETGGKKFKLNKMDAFKQFHVVRRIAPLLKELIPAFGSIVKTMKSMESMTEDEKLDVFAKVAGPVMEGLSKLSDQDADHVLYGLLACVEVQQETGGWARVSSGSTLMFQNMELPLLLQLAGRAFMFNLGGFFSALPQNS